MAQRLTVKGASTAITAEQVRAMTVDLLVEYLPLGVTGYRYTDEDVYKVLVTAADQQRSIESVCQQLIDAPSANLVRQYLADWLRSRWELEALEGRCDDLLAARVPPDLPQHRHRVAMDLHLVHYYGAPPGVGGGAAPPRPGLAAEGRGLMAK